MRSGHALKIVKARFENRATAKPIALRKLTPRADAAMQRRNAECRTICTNPAGSDPPSGYLSISTH